MLFCSYWKICNLDEQWPSLPVCCEVTQKYSQNSSLARKITSSSYNICMIQCNLKTYLHTSYLYCSNRSLCVRTNWAFLLVKTIFPMILPNSSGLWKETDLSLEGGRKMLHSQLDIWMSRHLTCWQSAPVLQARSPCSAVEHPPAASSRPSATPCLSVCRWPVEGPSH